MPKATYLLPLHLPVKKKVALRNLSLGVSRGETLGLLGHNGAGKTTTMRMVTAEEVPTAGRVVVGGKEVVSNASEGLRSLGYCPQVGGNLSN